MVFRGKRLKKGEYLEKLAKHRKTQRQNAAFVKELKAVPCKDCRGRFPPDVMEFDHVPGRGGKIGCVGNRPTKRAIYEESLKCDVVCANCHRLRTARRRRSERFRLQERLREIDAIGRDRDD